MNIRGNGQQAAAAAAPPRLLFRNLVLLQVLPARLAGLGHCIQNQCDLLSGEAVPGFTTEIQNISAPLERDVTFTCNVKNIGQYKVGRQYSCTTRQAISDGAGSAGSCDGRATISNLAAGGASRCSSTYCTGWLGQGGHEGNPGDRTGGDHPQPAGQRGRRLRDNLQPAHQQGGLQ